MLEKKHVKFGFLLPSLNLKQYDKLSEIQLLQILSRITNVTNINERTLRLQQDIDLMENTKENNRTVSLEQVEQSTKNVRHFLHSLLISQKTVTELEIESQPQKEIRKEKGKIVAKGYIARNESPKITPIIKFQLEELLRHKIQQIQEISDQIFSFSQNRTENTGVFNMIPNEMGIPKNPQEPLMKSSEDFFPESEESFSLDSPQQSLKKNMENMSLNRENFSARTPQEYTQTYFGQPTDQLQNRDILNKSNTPNTNGDIHPYSHPGPGLYQQFPNGMRRTVDERTNPQFIPNQQSPYWQENDNPRTPSPMMSEIPQISPYKNGYYEQNIPSWTQIPTRKYPQNRFSQTPQDSSPLDHPGLNENSHPDFQFKNFSAEDHRNPNIKSNNSMFSFPDNYESLKTSYSHKLQIPSRNQNYSIQNQYAQNSQFKNSQINQEDFNFQNSQFKNSQTNHRDFNFQNSPNSQFKNSQTNQEDFNFQNSPNSQFKNSQINHQDFNFQNPPNSQNQFPHNKNTDYFGNSLSSYSIFSPNQHTLYQISKPRSFK
ncbi:hypothetical protein M0811_08869 [Anaeramoeba ignava]|uniref:Uncharacterized protein n=1 Tax=Anaeramoeba ignava TaxID=1746090 RepID=A0A9Q0LHV9_ANAIG|nr:hypothetical protein M0811_08869 [Anaeramoeba ignava]